MHMAGSPIFLQQKITYESRMERYRVDMRTFITRLEMTIQKDLDTELNIHMKGKELNINDIISFFFYILLIYQIFFF